ncbi:MAG: hypothetical protein KCHDKBKB_01950 [Elusimicrobia bacterium]|nr:hypothetical protein [Elusimicrobiota bacterium]
MSQQEHFCRSFQPVVSRSSRVLILGSMPGPEALRKQQYYGFNGNHFWTIVPALFNHPKPLTYSKKIALVRRYRIALWDVIETCVRPGALDSSIKNLVPNKIPSLLKKYPNIRAVFINGQFAHKAFNKQFKNEVQLPVIVLPSTSPANAAMPLKEKIHRWGVVRKFLYNPGHL